MKKFLALCIFAGLLALFSGCMIVAYTSSTQPSVRGTGEIITQSFNVDAFNSISVGANFTVIYRQSATPGLALVMHENFFDYIDVEVDANTLRVNSSVSFNTGRGNAPRMYIYAPYLRSVWFTAAVETYDWDLIQTRSLNIHVSGAATANIAMEVEALDLTASGAGSFNLSGNANSASVNITGAGSVNARYLQTATAEVVVAGAGSTTVAVSDRLDVTISGVGTVRYIGSPRVNQTVSGLGTVQQVD